MEPAHGAAILMELDALLCSHETHVGAGACWRGDTAFSRQHRQGRAQTAGPVLVFRGKKSSGEGLQESCLDYYYLLFIQNHC